MSETPIPAQSGLTEKASFFVLWRRPLVCVISSGGSAPLGIKVALALADGRECYILARPSWNMREQAAEIIENANLLRRDHRNARFTSLAGSQEDADLLRAHGVDALWANNLAFVDERIYFPELDAPKAYDAVYVAQSKGFKRHELAHGVPNLALITYAEPVPAAPTIASVIAGYRSLAYVNYAPETGNDYLSFARVREVMNRARCGLALSAIEGANNATMEYFLCGLPLVTTASEGGREAMYDPRHVTVVEPHPEAVAAAVAAYQIKAPDPLEIRASALAKTRSHRARLIKWLSERVSEDLSRLADGNLWLPQFNSKLRLDWTVESLVPGAVRMTPYDQSLANYPPYG